MFFKTLKVESIISCFGFDNNGHFQSRSATATTLFTVDISAFTVFASEKDHLAHKQLFL